MSELLTADVNVECFKVKDPRIDRLRSGKLSVQAFMLTLSADDPFVLIDKTLYLMTPQEYYATRPVRPISPAIQKTFDKMMALPESVQLNQQDRAFLQKVRAQLPTCPACKYKHYKDAVYNIAKKYNMAVTFGQDAELKIAPYPQTTQPPAAVVSNLLHDMFSMPVQQRRACIDCVQKHVSQAYILGNQILMGYPQHLYMMCAHLGQAIDQAPARAVDLRQTLIFCLSRTVYTNTPFLPLEAIAPIIELTRGSLVGEAEQDKDTRKQAPSTMQIDFTQDMHEQLKGISCSAAQKLCSYMKEARDSILEYKIKPQPAVRMSFQGAMANAADLVVQVCPKFANMLRNRRLLFKAAPDTASDAGYDCSDVIEYLQSVEGR